jgi:hypothetical protein
VVIHGFQRRTGDGSSHWPVIDALSPLVETIVAATRVQA